MLQFWKAEDSVYRALEVFPGGLLWLERGAAWLTGEATLASIKDLLFLLSPCSFSGP